MMNYNNDSLINRVLKEFYYKFFVDPMNRGLLKNRFLSIDKYIFL